MAHKSTIRSAKWLFWIFVTLMVITIGALVRYSIIISHRSSDSPTTLRVHGVVRGQLTLADTAFCTNSKTLGGTEEGVTAEASVQEFNLKFRAEDPALLKCRHIMWSKIVTGLEVSSLLLAVLLGIFCALSFYNSIKKQEKFSMKFIHAMAWIGVLLFFSSICSTVGHVLQSFVLRDLFPNAEGAANLRVNIEVTRMFFGLVVLFLAQMMRLNYKLQEEQELTI